MKRIGHIYNKIIDPQNLQLADLKASKGKAWQYGVRMHRKKSAENLLQLHTLLKQKTYRTSPYTVFTIHEPKEREIHRLPYFPDRITHHAVMNILEPVFVSNFTADTYSCIKGRGIHAAVRNIKTALIDRTGSQYCLKLDIRKFYPSIDHSILKAMLRRKFKDADLLWLLDEIIDSAPGLPIGNYLSQYLANFYLTGFDHWIKEQKQVKHYLRYDDDVVILAADKRSLHILLHEIKSFLQDRLNLQVKDNYQVFPVDARGIDFVGYRFFHTHTLVRKRIKHNYRKATKQPDNTASIASYKGWLKHCNSKHLIKTVAA